MEPEELRRLIVRHRHVAPMLSVLLAGTDARVTITDLQGGVILDRQAGGGAGAGTVERHPIVVDGTPVGWVAGPRPDDAGPEVPGRPGQKGWAGLANTTFFINTRERIVAVAMSQYVGPAAGEFDAAFRDGVYAAVARPIR